MKSELIKKRALSSLIIAFISNIILYLIMLVFIISTIIKKGMIDDEYVLNGFQLTILFFIFISFLLSLVSLDKSMFYKKKYGLLSIINVIMNLVSIMITFMFVYLIQTTFNFLYLYIFYLIIVITLMSLLMLKRILFLKSVDVKEFNKSYLNKVKANINLNDDEIYNKICQINIINRVFNFTILIYIVLIRLLKNSLIVTLLSIVLIIITIVMYLYLSKRIKDQFINFKKLFILVLLLSSSLVLIILNEYLWNNNDLYKYIPLISIIYLKYSSLYYREDLGLLNYKKESLLENE